MGKTNKMSLNNSLHSLNELDWLIFIPSNIAMIYKDYYEMHKFYLIISKTSKYKSLKGRADSRGCLPRQQTLILISELVSPSVLSTKYEHHHKHNQKQRAEDNAQ